MYTTLTYLIYIIATIFITVFVARTLSKNGEIYLVDGFDGNELLASSVNHMLVVGFYLLNLGFALLRMRTNTAIESVEGMVVYLSSGLGFVLFALGIAHFFNMYVISQFRKNKTKTANIQKNETESWS
ncbi:MAG: hypothetical protein ACRBEE_09180 [Arenicella sp.]